MEPSRAEKGLKLSVVIIFLLLCLRQIWNGVYLLRVSGGVIRAFRGVLRFVTSSYWAAGGIVDCIGGALFAALYVYLRRGPPLLGIPVSVIAVLCILLGSFMPLLYISVLLLGESSLRAIAPGVAVDDAEDADEKWLQPRVVGGFFAGYLVLYIIIWGIAFSNESVRYGWNSLFKNVYARSLTESYLHGVIVTALLLAMFEGGKSWAALLWVIAVVVFGNGAAYVYAFITARKAVLDGSSFRKALLTPGNTSSADGVSLTTRSEAVVYSAI